MSDNPDKVKNIFSTNLREFTSKPTSRGISQAERNTARELRDRHQQRTERIDNLPYIRVIGAQQYLYTREYLDRISCNITKSTTATVRNTAGGEYSKDNAGTVMDTNMGSIINTIPCTNCCQYGQDCDGHEGKIMFYRIVNGQKEANPIFHPSYIPEILDGLKSLHYKCGCLILRNKIPYSNYSNFNNRLKRIGEESEGHECVFCRSGGRNPDYSVQSSNPMVIVSKLTKNSPEKIVSPLDVYNIFMSVSDDDLKLLGFNVARGGNRLADFILFGIPVTSPLIRPPKMVKGVMEDNDFTKRYNDIVAKNNAIMAFGKEIKSTMSISSINDTYRDMTNKLAEAVRELFQGGGATARQDTQKVLSNYKEELVSKEGAFRYLLGSKTVNFCGRSVAAPGSDLAVDEVGIPASWASELTIPEIAGNITDVNGDVGSNMPWLNKLLADGKVSSIERNRQTIIINDANRRQQTVTFGDVVNRHAMNGDYAYINRNPSLHGPSFRALRLVLLPIQTIMVNQALTKGFGLDFDGDEVNLHFPQTLEARAEMITLSDPRNCLTSLARGGVLVAGIIDTLVGAYLMTHPDVEIDRSNWLRGFDSLKAGIYDLNAFVQRAKRFGYNHMTGRGLFSLLLPTDLYFKAPLKKPQYEDGVAVTHLEIRNGLLIKGAITDEHIGAGGNLADYLIQQQGETFYINFLSDLQWLTNWFLMYHGFTVSLSDCTIFDRDPIKTRNLDNFTRQKLEQAKTFGGPSTNPIEENRRQANIANTLGAIKEYAIKEFEDEYNASSLAVMAESGAKGNNLNAAMMAHAIGLQTVGGRLIKGTLGRGEDARTTPFYPVGANVAQAIGYVARSFGEGLTPSGSLLNAQETRRALADGKVKVSSSGYFTRRLGKTAEDIVVAYNLSVVDNINKRIQQYIYGGIGLNPAYLSVEKDEEGSYYTYVSVSNVVMQYNIAYQNDHPEAPPARTPTEADLQELTDIFYYNDRSDPLIISNIPGIGPQVQMAHHELLRRQLRKTQVIMVPEVVEKIKASIKRNLLRALIQPGTPCGHIMATSIGEVATQLNLKQKTLIGTGSAKSLNIFDMTNALIAMSKTPSNRTSFIFFDPPITINEAYGSIKDFQYIDLDSLIIDTSIININTAQDNTWFSVYTNLFEFPDDEYLDYVLRIKLNQQLCYNYNIQVKDIADIIRNHKDMQKLVVVNSPNHIGIIDIYARNHEDLDELEVNEGQDIGDAVERFYRNVIGPGIRKIAFSGIKDITSVYPSYLSYVRGIRNEVKVAKENDSTTWKVFLDQELMRQFPITSQKIGQLLTELNFELVQVNKTNLIVTTTGPKSPRMALTQEADQLKNFDHYNIIYLECTGTNMVEILKRPGVDSRYTYSDHSIELYKLYGIIPAKRMFYTVFSQTLTTVSPIHILLLADLMHRNGVPNGINLSGVIANNPGQSLSEASFEQAEKRITKGAPYNVEQKVGINVSIMTGLPAPVGTGYVTVITPRPIYDELSRITDKLRKGQNTAPVASRAISSKDELDGIDLLNRMEQDNSNLNELLPAPISLDKVIKDLKAKTQAPAISIEAGATANRINLTSNPAVRNIASHGDFNVALPLVTARPTLPTVKGGVAKIPTLQNQPQINRVPNVIPLGRQEQRPVGILPLISLGGTANTKQNKLVNLLGKK